MYTHRHNHTHTRSLTLALKWRSLVVACTSNNHSNNNGNSPTPLKVFAWASTTAAAATTHRPQHTAHRPPPTTHHSCLAQHDLIWPPLVQSHSLKKKKQQQQREKKTYETPVDAFPFCRSAIEIDIRNRCDSIVCLAHIDVRVVVFVLIYPAPIKCIKNGWHLWSHKVHIFLIKTGWVDIDYLCIYIFEHP